ncbi:MAG TPA: hypothetical protein VGB20_00240 [bacterium]
MLAVVIGLWWVLVPSQPRVRLIPVPDYVQPAPAPSVPMDRA